MTRAAMLLTFFLVQALYAQNAKEPFFVMTQGLKGEREALQVKAELQMARDTRYCRGAMIPAAQKSWSCEGVGPGVERCEREYKCERVRSDLSRLSETRRLIEKRKKYSAISGEHVINTRPDIKLSRVSLPATNAPLKKERGISLRDQSQRIVDMGVARNTSRINRQSRAASPSLDPILSFDQDDQSKNQDQSEILELLQEEQSLDEDQMIPLESVAQKDVAGLRLLRIAVSYLRASDDVGEGISTFNYAWVPRYRFANGFGLRAQVGFHQYTLALSAQEEESFTVIDTFGLIQYTFQHKWTIEAGLGQQVWGSEFLGGVSGTMIGASYEWGHPWLETISVQSTSLSGASEDGFLEVNVSELRLSLSTSF